MERIIDKPKVKKMAWENDMDEILAYMHMMLREANNKEISIRREKFIEHGREIKFFPGVEEWFGHINNYAQSKSVNLKHYIIFVLLFHLQLSLS